MQELGDDAAGFSVVVCDVRYLLQDKMLESSIWEIAGLISLACFGRKPEWRGPVLIYVST